MAHYAQVNSENIVTQVIVYDDGDNETKASADLKKMFGGKWLKTSYNTFQGTHKQGGIPLRGNYAGIGYLYDETLDAFLHPKPYPSWILDPQLFSWVPPVPKPALNCLWNEDTQTWTILDESN